MMEAHREHLTQGNFKERFLEKYFPNSARYAKEVEFMKLKQGNMTVHEYTSKFEHLVHLYSQTTTKAWMCRRFEEKLKFEVKMVVPLAIREFLKGENCGTPRRRQQSDQNPW